MSAISGTTAAKPGGGALATVGALVVYLGLAAIAVSTVWTTKPLALPGLHERYVIALLGFALVASAAIGRGRFAASTPGRLLSALGVAVCLRLAVDPIFEDLLPDAAANWPMWVLDAYPGLATVGWLVAGLGAFVWWLGKGAQPCDRLFVQVTLVCAVLLAAVALLVRAALTSAGYDIPAFGTWLLVWRIAGVAVTVVVLLSTTGEKRFGPWPLVIIGLALMAHAGRVISLAAGEGGEAL